MSLEVNEQPGRITREEYLSIPEGPPYFELDEEVLIPVTPPHGRHQELLSKLIIAFGNYLEKMRSGKYWPEVGVELVESKIYIPDVSYLSNENLGRYNEHTGRITGPPDLVVEILSPESVGRDRLRKFNMYFEHGVVWYWIVDPIALTIEEYHAGQEGYYRGKAAGKGETFKPEALPGLELMFD